MDQMGCDIYGRIGRVACAWETDLVDLVERQLRRLLDDDRVEGGGEPQVVLCAERLAAEVAEAEASDGSLDAR